MLLTNPGSVDLRRDGPRRVVRPILRRLETDDGLRRLMEERLLGRPTASEKVTLTRLVALARGLSPDLRNWCVAEIEAQARRTAPEVGFELTAGALRPVAHSLLSLLSASSGRL